MARRRLSSIFDNGEILGIEAQVQTAAQAGDLEAVMGHADLLLSVQAHQRPAAEALLRLVTRGVFPVEEACGILAALMEAHANDLALVATIGGALEFARDIDMLNAPAPEPPLFGRVVALLSEALEVPRPREQELWLLDGLMTAARLLGRAGDEVCERTCLRLIEIEPEKAAHHYSYGLFLKTRGRFEEGLAANLRARELAPQPVAPYEWNAGICATGAGRGDVALEIWQGLGNRLTLGASGLPEGRYGGVKVRLAQRPLAERTAEADDPGLEETIWIERLSPCHGIVRSVLVQPLGVDYGDVVLIDGAPITYHAYGDTKIPVFPHLATLKRRFYRMFDFAGTQGGHGEIAELASKLGDDAVIYVHTEQYRQVCANCWRDPDLDHAHHSVVEKNLVQGRIALPPGMTPQQLVGELDAAVAAAGSVQVYAPALRVAAGQAERASVDQRRFGMIAGPLRD